MFQKIYTEFKFFLSFRPNQMCLFYLTILVLFLIIFFVFAFVFFRRGINIEKLTTTMEMDFVKSRQNLKEEDEEVHSDKKTWFTSSVNNLLP